MCFATGYSGGFQTAPPPEPTHVPPSEDPLLRTARREMLVVVAFWLATLLYTVGYCYRFGYNRAAEELTFVLGFPDWIFWGIVVPWVVCFLFSLWFASFFMTDVPLGGDEAEEPSHG